MSDLTRSLDNWSRRSETQFEWVDSTLVTALKEGHWLVVSNANFCRYVSTVEKSFGKCITYQYVLYRKMYGSIQIVLSICEQLHILYVLHGCAVCMDNFDTICIIHIWEVL